MPAAAPLLRAWRRPRRAGHTGHGRQAVTFCQGRILRLASMGLLVEDAVTEVREAHDGLLRSRSQILAQRDALNTQLARIDAAIEALRDIISTAPEPLVSPKPPPSSGPTISPQADITTDEAMTSGTEPGSDGLGQAAKPITRKARIREITLESPDVWFTAAEMATRIEHRVPSEARRTATYEMMRRMTKQGELELDSSARPTRFRARPQAIRERLLADGR